MSRIVLVNLVAVSLLALAACAEGRQEVAVGEGDILGSQTVQHVFPSKAGVVTVEHGKELWFAVGPVAGTGGVNANGVAQAHFMEDGMFIAAVQINIERAPDGFFYEGWLRNPVTDALESAGHFRTPFGDVRHSLEFRKKADLRTAGITEVSLEADDGDPGQGKIVALGALQERGR